MGQDPAISPTRTEFQTIANRCNRLGPKVSLNQRGNLVRTLIPKLEELSPWLDQSDVTSSEIQEVLAVLNNPQTEEAINRSEDFSLQRRLATTREKLRVLGNILVGRDLDDKPSTTIKTKEPKQRKTAATTSTPSASKRSGRGFITGLDIHRAPTISIKPTSNRDEENLATPPTTKAVKAPPIAMMPILATAIKRLENPSPVAKRRAPGNPHDLLDDILILISRNADFLTKLKTAYASGKVIDSTLVKQNLGIGRLRKNDDVAQIAKEFNTAQTYLHLAIVNPASNAQELSVASQLYMQAFDNLTSIPAITTVRGMIFEAGSIDVLKRHAETLCLERNGTQLDEYSSETLRLLREQRSLMGRFMLNTGNQAPSFEELCKLLDSLEIVINDFDTLITKIGNDPDFTEGPELVRFLKLETESVKAMFKYLENFSNRKALNQTESDALEHDIHRKLEARFAFNVRSLPRSLSTILNDPIQFSKILGPISIAKASQLNLEDYEIALFKLLYGDWHRFASIVNTATKRRSNSAAAIKESFEDFGQELKDLQSSLTEDKDLDQVRLALLKDLLTRIIAGNNLNIQLAEINVDWENKGDPDPRTQATITKITEERDRIFIDYSSLLRDSRNTIPSAFRIISGNLPALYLDV